MAIRPHVWVLPQDAGLKGSFGDFGERFITSRSVASFGGGYGMFTKTTGSGLGYFLARQPLSKIFLTSVHEVTTDTKDLTTGHLVWLDWLSPFTC